MSAIPGGLGKLGKLGKTAVTAGKKAKTVADSAKVVTPPATGTSQNLLSRVKTRITTPPAETPDTKLAQAGQKIRASNRGIQAGDRVGKEVLDETKAKELNDAISSANRGLTGRTVRGQVKGVQQAKQAATEELNAAAAASKGIVAPEMKQKAATEIAKGRKNILTFDEKNPSHVDLNNRYAERLNNANSPKEILEARRVFSQAAKKKYANPDATQTLDKELASVYYNQANKLLDDIAPEVRAADKKVSTYIDAEKALTSSKSKVDASGVKPLGTSINGRGIGGGVFQAGADTAGKALEAVGGNSVPARFARGLTGQVASRAIVGPALNQTPVEGTATESTPVDSTSVSDTPSTTDVSGGSMATLGKDGVNQALQAAALQALARGDTQGIAAIKTVMDIVGAGQKAEKPLSAEAAKIVSNAKTGLSAIDDFESLIGENPGAFSRTNIPGVGVADNLTGGRVGGALGTAEIDAAADQIIDVIARLRTGAAISQAEETRFKRFIPRPGDPPEARAQKLNYLRNQFNMVAERSGSAGTDIEQAVTGA